MLKKRLIACLTIKQDIVVQSLKFHTYLPVGSPVIAAEFLNYWGIDEIVLLDLDATSRKQGPNINLTTQVSRKIFVPLTVGGGIRHLKDMRRLVHYGADKVALNTIIFTHPQLITEGANIFGTQCIVISLDVKRQSGRYQVFTQGGKVPTGKNPVTLAQEVAALGAGEILLTSIDRDGTQQGYDLKLIRQVSTAVTIPVVACGGAGHPRHFLSTLVTGKASAAAAGNFWHFTEHSPIVVKSYLAKHQLPIRLDTYATYKQFDFRQGRIARQSEAKLYQLKFTYLPPEII